MPTQPSLCDTGVRTCGEGLRSGLGPSHLSQALLQGCLYLESPSGAGVPSARTSLGVPASSGDGSDGGSGRRRGSGSH